MARQLKNRWRSEPRKKYREHLSMKLAQLFSIFPQLRWGDAATVDVVDITQDSRAVHKGSVFVAIRGTAADGHQFLQSAVEQGAVGLVLEDMQNVPREYQGAVAQVPSTRRAFDLLAGRFYGDPAKELFCVGVTGTNGKTTTTYMIEKILTHFNWKTGVMGTIDHHLGEHRWPSALTTPDSLTLQRRLSEIKALGASAVVLEVSSHALAQARVDSLPFAVGVFTNLTRDHLDYHRDMEDYFHAKERLFTELLGNNSNCAVAVLNGDDPWIRKIRVREGVKVWWYGQSAGDFAFRSFKQNLAGTLVHLSTPRGSGEFQLAVPGLHNVYNATAAVAASMSAGVSLNAALAALAEFRGTPGRLERVNNHKDLHIFVDYAHTDDALRTVLQMLHDLKANSSKIITVFGCGGDRDKGKRPLMGKVAASLSDRVILTSDNPRKEDPLLILHEIKSGISAAFAGELQIEPDRRQALALALQSAKEGDVILVAGKGHEDYQIVGKEKFSFSDQQVLGELLKA